MPGLRTNRRARDTVEIIRFRRWLGHTPHEEIQRVRINRIRELLSETDLSIHEIASRAGFIHGEYMAAAFKRETGMTPTEFRDSAGT